MWLFLLPFCSCVSLSDPILLCLLPHSKLNVIQPCWYWNAVWLQRFGFMEDCWLKCHILRGIGFIEATGTRAHTGVSVLPVVSLPSLLLTAFMLPLFVCFSCRWWCGGGGQFSLNRTHTAPICSCWETGQKLLPLSPLILLSCRQGVGWQQHQWSLLIWAVS